MRPLLLELQKNSFKTTEMRPLLELQKSLLETTEIRPQLELQKSLFQTTEQLTDCTASTLIVTTDLSIIQIKTAEESTN